MAQFDPLKKPMSLAESEELLKGHARHEASKDAWKTFGLVTMFLAALAFLVGSLIWGFFSAPSSTALVVFALVVIPFIFRK